MRVQAECKECGYRHSIKQDEDVAIFHIDLYRCSICGSTKVTRDVIESTITIFTNGLEKLKSAINGEE